LPSARRVAILHPLAAWRALFAITEWLSEYSRPIPERCRRAWGGWAVHLGKIGKELNHIIESDHYPLAADPGAALHPGKVPNCAKRTVTGQTADTPRTSPRASVALWSAAAF
jgi:hypothetical protein